MTAATATESSERHTPQPSARSLSSPSAQRDDQTTVVVEQSSSQQSTAVQDSSSSSSLVDTRPRRSPSASTTIVDSAVVAASSTSTSPPDADQPATGESSIVDQPTVVESSEQSHQQEAASTAETSSTVEPSQQPKTADESSPPKSVVSPSDDQQPRVQPPPSPPPQPPPPPVAPAVAAAPPPQMSSSASKPPPPPAVSSAAAPNANFHSTLLAALQQQGAAATSANAAFNIYGVPPQTVAAPLAMPPTSINGAHALNPGQFPFNNLLANPHQKPAGFPFPSHAPNMPPGAAPPPFGNMFALPPHSAPPHIAAAAHPPPQFAAAGGAAAAAAAAARNDEGASASPKRADSALLNSMCNRSQRCGVCKGCTNSACGQCAFCQDSPVFGGPGVKKQSCLERRCHRVLENKLQRDAPSFRARSTCQRCDECRAPDCQSCLVCWDRKHFKNTYLPGASCARKRCNNAVLLDNTSRIKKRPSTDHTTTAAPYSAKPAKRPAPADFPGAMGGLPLGMAPGMQNRNGQLGNGMVMPHSVLQSNPAAAAALQQRLPGLGQPHAGMYGVNELGAPNFSMDPNANRLQFPAMANGMCLVNNPIMNPFLYQMPQPLQPTSIAGGGLLHQGTALVGKGGGASTTADGLKTETSQSPSAGGNAASTDPYQPPSYTDNSSGVVLQAL